MNLASMHRFPRRDASLRFSTSCARFQAFISKAIPCLVLALVLGVVQLVPCAAVAQNPFGEGSQAVAPEPSSPTALNPDFFQRSTSGTDLIISSIAESDPRTPDDLVMAINTLLNLEVDTETKKYVVKLRDALGNASDLQLFSLHRNTGTPFFIDLASRDGLQPEGRQLSEKVLDAAWRHTYDPSRLNELTKQLDHENIYSRSDALEQLGNAGEPGAAAIINALADASREKQFPFLRTALTKLGDVAVNPLIGAVLSENPIVRLEATNLLGMVDSYNGRLALYHPFVAANSDRLRSVAQNALERQLGYAPTRGEIEIELFEAARDFGAPTPIDPYEPETFETVWEWKETGGMVPNRVRKDVAKQLLAARFSEALLFSRPNEATYQQLYLVSALQAMKSAGGVDQPLNAAFADSIHRRFSAGQISQALGNAIDRKLTAGAVAACEMLAHFQDESILDSVHGRPCNLVRALQYGDQRVMFAAAKTISLQSLRRPFAGSSQYLAALVYMSTSSGQRKILVGHSNPTMAQSWAESIARSGYETTTATGARELYRVAITDPDIESILISDTINQPDYLELTQMLRRDWRSKLTPIGIAHGVLDQPRIAAYLDRDALTMGLPLTLDPGIIGRQLSHLQLRNGLDPIRNDTRMKYAQWASDQLAKLTEQETPVVKYDFAAHQVHIARGLYKNETSQASSRVLGRVGTPFAQRQLVSAASQIGLTNEARRAATTALGDAFRTNGILLTRAEIIEQYDIYNTSVNESEETREILSIILDLIEKK